MKNILLCTDGSMFADVTYQYGIWLAKGLNARINVLSVTDIRSQQVASTGNLSGSIGLGASEDLLNQLVNLEHEKAKLNHQKAKLILNHAQETLQNGGISNLTLIHKTGFLLDFVTQFEPDSDLILLGKRGENADFASEHLGANLDRIVRSSHKPCFVTPREFKPIEKVVFAYDASATGKKIIKFLQNFSLIKGLELQIIKIRRHDIAVTQANLREAQEKLADFNPTTHLLEGHPEKVICDFVRDENCLLIMGAYGHNRIRHLVIGSTTAQVLRKSRVPVLLLR